MRRLALVLAVWASLGSVEAVLAAEAKAEEKKAEPVLALSGSDPVELTQGRTVAGSKQLSVTHLGLRYQFKDAANQARFRAEPDRYRIQGDGSCPVIPSVKVKPDIYTVYNERIYAFASIPCIATFMQDPDKYVKEMKKGG